MALVGRCLLKLFNVSGSFLKAGGDSSGNVGIEKMVFHEDRNMFKIVLP